MTSEVQTLKNPFNNNRKLTEQQLKKYQKSYHELKLEILVEDKQFTTHQIQKLKQSLQSLKDISNKAASTKKQCQLTIQRLRGQSQAYAQKINEYQRIYKSTNKQKELKQQIVKLQHQHISNCKHRIEISKNTDIYSFKNLQIEERKSIANQLFKWIMVTFYQEPQNKYYWPNFQKQAITTDKGQDLKERLAKIDSIHAKEQQRVKTIKFIEQYQQIAKSPQFKNYTTQLKNLFQIAKYFNSSVQAGREINKLQNQIASNRAAFIKSDEENLKNINNNKAVLQRIRVSQAYLEQLNQMNKLISNKVEQYNSQIALGDSYFADLGKVSTYVEQYKAPVESSQKRQNCQCRVM